MPRELRKSSVGSQTQSVSSFSPAFTKSVMSIVKVFCPPSWGTSVTSVCPMKTIVRKSTAPKWRRMRVPGCGLQVILRVYQRNSSG